MARGAALIKGNHRIFSEAFGANGWGEGLRMVKWIGDRAPGRLFQYMTPTMVARVAWKVKQPE